MEGTAMSEPESPALAVALAYYRAWTSHDFDLAMTLVSDDIVCEAPSGRITGAEAFRAFMGPFSKIVVQSRLVAAFGNEETALLMYDTATRPVPDAPGAECLTVVDGRIRALKIIFDSAPFAAARAAAGTE